MGIINKLKMQSRLCIFLIALILINSSCEKNSVTESDKGISIVKVFDDTLANPSAWYNRIVAGNDRLFMTYGHGNTNIDPTTASIQILVTDNEGAFIKHNSLPKGNYLYGLISQNDGTFVVATATNTYFYNNTSVILNHYNRDGEFISNDSVALPFESFIYSVSLSQQGNILITGSNNISMMNYMLECDVSGNILWSNPSSLPLFNPAATSDGGYVFFIANGNNTIRVVKTGVTGNPVWQKDHSFPFAVTTGNIWQNKNGNYWIYMHNDISSSNNWDQPGDSYLFVLNDSGDSVRLQQANKEYSFYFFYFPNTAIQRDDGSTFILHGSPEWFIGGPMAMTTGLVNTHYSIFDADANLIKQGTLQDETTDVFNAICKTQDGRTVCFGMLNSYYGNNYRPCLVFLR